MSQLIRTLLLFLTALLLQLFLFDNLAISIYLNPLIYIGFVLLLPLDAPPALVLGAGLLIGLATDCTMGGSGAHTIASLLVAFVRPWLLRCFYHQDKLRKGDAVSAMPVQSAALIQYLVAAILLHHFVFFLLEALSWSHLLDTLLRTVLSGALTLACLLIINKLLSAKIFLRI